MSEAYEITEPPVGPMTARDLAIGAEFELHAGYPVRCMPTGGDGARASI
ncbi:MAG: hypothetical protein HYV07_33765, partial [Deltaproteobacteria bacterium]|nr:hypothetical protein [Deltaproteobacteria bacterium]